MPIYSYLCDQHGEFDDLKTISKRNEKTNCPQCNKLAMRRISAVNLAVMSDSNRKAWQRNEKSMHEPRLASRQNTCSHEHKHSAPGSQLKNLGRNTRPWMLGH